MEKLRSQDKIDEDEEGEMSEPEPYVVDPVSPPKK
tara:strand:+ start:319 stop:423 length:105 start_codon:yes stop_codon:yes gene_type:complete